MSKAGMLVVAPDGLDRIITTLREGGRTVIGPVVRDGVVTHSEIASLADLPIGWTEDQDGGRYRLEATGTDESFAFSCPCSSWKRFLHPERTLLIRANRRNGHVSVEEPESRAPKMAFFGIRSCDLAAIAVLDRVLLDPTATDPTYAARREDLFIVAAACNNPGNTCFCASMGTGPSPQSGYDLAIRELFEQNDHRFVVEVGSQRGADLLNEIDSRAVTSADTDAAERTHDHAVEAMGRRLDPTDPPLAALSPDHQRWDEIAQRCFACGNCTMVCPTCFCSQTSDHTDLANTKSERWSTWDSCFSIDFSYLHGGAVRTETRSRYRQWLLHKLVIWHEQFDSSGCVGCGRCITWCPVGIDLTVEIAALASEPDRQNR